MPEERLTDEEILNMTEAGAHFHITRAVYKALDFVERLEVAGKLLGNGHNFRQTLAEEAGRQLLNRWNKTANQTNIQTDVT